MTGEQTAVTVRTADLGPLLGQWDPETRTIWLHHDLTPAERRCTLAHELVHALRGDERCATDILTERQEATVRRLTAEILIPLPRLTEALRWCRDDHELAEELEVDLDTVIARRESLTPAEIDLLQTLIARLERAA
jgi:Zn-dependent peptidase ImmA (M78 family)